jgi:hypothetical protein
MRDDEHERHRRNARVELERSAWLLRKWIAEHTNNPWTAVDAANFAWFTQRADSAQRAVPPAAADDAYRQELLTQISELEELVELRRRTHERRP